jgi:ADP-ribose diphosphatase
MSRKGARARSRKPTVLGIKTATRSRYFHIESVQLRFGNGAERVFERVAGTPHIGTVLVVALPDPRSVLLVREYAVGLDRYELTVPMGCVEPGETPEQAANRELQEETGFGARSLRRLCSLSVAPSIFGYRAEVVIASDLFKSRLTGDEAERPECITWPLDRITQAATRQQIREARTLAAILLARDVLANARGV